MTTKKKKDDEASNALAVDQSTQSENHDAVSGALNAERAQQAGALDREIARDAKNAPTPGRIVNYTNEEGDSYPAMVSAVDGGKLHLTVFDAVMGPRLNCVDVATYGDDRGAWRWPARA